MLSKDKNDLITLTGPGTPGGNMMRAYWQPVALAAELVAEMPLAVRILSEDLVLFRDAAGAPQLIGRYCPHRLVDLSFGRVEPDGLRCIYHGWVMSGQGRCLEQPGEGADSSFKDRIRHTAYPCMEAAGLIFAFMGRGEPPRVPRFEFFDPAKAAQVWTGKLHHDCNYLQAAEGNVDPQHLSYLHRFLSQKEALDPRGNALVATDVAPKIGVEETEYGMRIRTVREVGEGAKYIRITNHIMPNCSAFGGVPLFDPAIEPTPDDAGYQLHWHVPIDDGSHWKYTVLFSHERALDKNFVTNKLFAEQKSFYSRRTRDNRYLQDRDEMRRVSYAGVGRNFFDHDKLAVESQGQGPIMDRANEHLGTTDRPVIVMRQLLLSAVRDVQEGRDPLFVERDGSANALADMAVWTILEPARTKAKEAASL
jgi:phthalate 4,5-dioxygenase